jgi:hypothetical protein
MTELEKKLRRPLKTSEIDFRIQSINQGKYATILAYKDARADMNRLDEVFGVFGWKREHSRDNRNCTVSIFDKEINQWISKEDTGTESQSEAEKGLASDSFKRACFNIGIGRELYDYPLISVRLNDDEVQTFNGKLRPSFKLNLRDWKWESNFDEHFNIIKLVGYDTNGKERYTWEKGKEYSKQEIPEPKQVNTSKANFTVDEIKIIALKVIACKDIVELEELYNSDVRIKTNKYLCNEITKRKADLELS